MNRVKKDFQETGFFEEARIMNYNDLIFANEEAIKNDYNRVIELDAFFYSVRKFGYNPKDIFYPVLPVMIHEHSQGKKVPPHLRGKIVGPFNEDTGIVVQAMLDITFDVYRKLPVYDFENKRQLRAN